MTAKRSSMVMSEKPVVAAAPKSKALEVVAGCAKCSSADLAAFVAEMNKEEENEHKLATVTSCAEVEVSRPLMLFRSSSTRVEEGPRECVSSKQEPDYFGRAHLSG